MARCFGLATKLVKENEPEGNPQDFPSIHKVNNGLYTLLANVFLVFPMIPKLDSWTHSMVLDILLCN